MQVPSYQSVLLVNLADVGLSQPSRTSNEHSRSGWLVFRQKNSQEMAISIPILIPSEQPDRQPVRCLRNACA